MRPSVSTPYRAVSTQLEFKYVPEWEDEFLALFPHRFDYIWAEQPNPGAEVEWKTESGHPLSDRLIQQGRYLFGVRFGAETNYCLLDIDAGSFYHPNHDSFAISRIVAALEPLGLVGHIACTSSYSGGLHLYFPFEKAQSSWQIAIALTYLLENAGFKLQPGQLEVFPNPKPYTTDGKISLFNAHRLPLQIGSYLLNKGLQPIWSSSEIFVKQWHLNQQRNSVDSKILKQILKQTKRKHFSISGKAEKFINDLNTEIELGWTGYGQTNRLLGRITMRAYIFNHVLTGGERLKGELLVKEIIKTARLLPGYEEWCRHQHEIEQRAEEWARCIENSHYFHFGDQIKKPGSESENETLSNAIDQSPSWNQQRSAATRDRIRHAIADLLEANCLPVKPTARFQALLKHGIGGASLYRHRDLWHPSYFETSTSDQAAEKEPQPPHENKNNYQSLTSLLSIADGNAASSNRSTDHSQQSQGSTGSNSVGMPTSTEAMPTSQQSQSTQEVFDIEIQQEVGQEAVRLANEQQQRIKQEAFKPHQIMRMQQFLASGDPILISEALAWAQLNPSVLKVDTNVYECKRARIEPNQSIITTEFLEKTAPRIEGEEH